MGLLLAGLVYSLLASPAPGAQAQTPNRAAPKHPPHADRTISGRCARWLQASPGEINIRRTRDRISLNVGCPAARAFASDLKNPPQIRSGRRDRRFPRPKDWAIRRGAVRPSKTHVAGSPPSAQKAKVPHEFQPVTARFPQEHRPGRIRSALAATRLAIWPMSLS